MRTPGERASRPWMEVPVSATDEGGTGKQGFREFYTPEHETIYRVSRTQVEMMEAATDPEGWVFRGMEHLVLRTVGRRSGREHKVALPNWRDSGGMTVVVASNAGAPSHPAWYLNLTDRDANPDVLVKTREGEYRTVPEILDGRERDRIWALLIRDRPFYADYQEGTDRVIPLVRLPR